VNTEIVKVLLAQNENTDLNAVRQYLGLTHYRNIEFQIVQGFEQVKQAMLEVDYNVCLLDESLGNERGLDLIYRTQLVRPDAAIILLASTDNYELDVAAMRAGAVNYLVVDTITSELLDRTIRHSIERKRIESSLNYTQQKAAQLAAIVEGSEYAILGKTLDGIVTSWNQAAEDLYGYTANEMIGQPVSKLAPPERPHEIESLISAIARGEKVRAYETIRVAKDGRRLDIALSLSPTRDAAGHITGASIIANDIGQRKYAERQIEKQLLRIQALRNIDMAITGSIDLRVTLNVLLDQVTTHLNVDSAAVLLTNPHTHRLKFATGRGFRSTGLNSTNLRIGDGAAGRAALSRQIVSIDDLSKDSADFKRMSMIDGEGFVAYWAAPLITKGRVAGVLEVYHRNKLTIDSDWMDFLETLAGQAAIAIENADLFNDLQRTNIELEIAYDTTLEGWSKALDLRDRETEGHTLRVTDGAVQLGRAMNIPASELVQIRRGALLHDIGKMGVPDSILLKQGALTPAEWEVMKKHPLFAYELLAPIPYLKEALDIPYCHHEKWDGSGYPRGLKGEQIPLAARLFALVDVWDALRSNRPYRAAWPEDKIREHLSASRGTHFDPEITDMFLNLDVLH